MNAARAICQNGLAVKLSRHHTRQRATVRRSTPTASVSCRIRAPVVAVPHDRDQHHDRGEIDLAAEEAQRRRRRPRAAAVHRTAEAEALVMLLAQSAGPATRLAPVAGGMQHAAAQRASCASCRIGKIPIEGEQQVVEFGVGQQGSVQGMRPSQLQVVDRDGQDRTQ